MTVTVDSTAHTADASFPTADGYFPAHIVAADLSEPVGGHVTADSTLYTADNTIWPRADGGVLPGALDASDALVIAAEVPVTGGRHYPRLRPYPIEGVGYGILPELEGEAHGVVGVAGQSAAQVLVRADAIGACGQAGDAVAVLKGLSVASKGVVGARGSGSGMIVRCEGAATGRHDNDEAAVIAFLLAA